MDDFIDRHPRDASWGHHHLADHEGIRLHYVRQGAGAPVLLLHGWPGFWYDWRRVIPRLAARGFDVIAPDYRGFGESDKPDLPPESAYSVQAQGASIHSLLERLDVSPVIVVGYDVGARVAQDLARSAPSRVRAVVLLNPSYPGIGERRLAYPAQREFWYQHFHNLPGADALIGHNRETVRIYLSHFYDHWVGRKESVRPVEFEAIVDTYAAPGAVRGGLTWYRSGAGTGLAPRTAEPAPETLRVMQPTRILWGDSDPIFPLAWTDRLPEFFPDMTLRILPGVGHFVPFEAPDDVVDAIEQLR